MIEISSRSLTGLHPHTPRGRAEGIPPGGPAVHVRPFLQHIEPAA